MRRAQSPSLVAVGLMALALTSLAVVSGSTVAAAKTPKITSHGGPVMGGTEAGQVTVTPIYWDPASTLGASYESVINGFVTNVAAAANSMSDDFSVLLQYNIHYAVQAGTPIVDTDAFPAGGCTPDSGAVYSDNSSYTSCLTDAQIQAELATVITAHTLTSNLANLYVIFLPKGVESCSTSSDGTLNGTCSVNSSVSPFYCGYHSAAGASGTPPIYATVPFPIYDSPTLKTCSDPLSPGAQGPNGTPVDPDVAVSTLSGEIIGAITDPEGNGWYDKNGRDINYDCRQQYGPVLGGTAPKALYNETINGAHYFLQEVLSNEDFMVRRAACVQRVDLPTSSFRFSPLSPIAGRSVPFNAKRSKGSGITQYSWNFSDGTSLTGPGYQKIRHTFVTRGTYTVSLTVTDVVGLQDTTATTSVQVSVR